MKHLVHSMRALGVAALLAIAAGCADSPTDTPTLNGGQASTAAAASMQAVAGSSQSATVGTAVPVAPAVVIKDTQGAPVAGVRVNFTVTMGGGNVNAPSTVTDAQGLANAGGWTLGSGQGGNVVEATSSNLTPVRFLATGVAAAPAPAPTVGAYNITIRYLATATTRQQQAVARALARWQVVITNDLPDIPMTAAANACFTGQPALNERIDDIIIYVEFVSIDGSGNTLGEAGPCYIRSDTDLPVVGHLKLDAADLALMERSGTLDDVVLHEMGHILGIGTLWPDKNLVQGAGTTDPRFTGRAALAAYQGFGGTAASIALENTGGAGTRDAHWRESTFGDELMTGYISGTPNPLSALTIASLADLGYGTTADAASGYTLSGSSAGIVGGIDLHGREKVKRPKFRVDRNGRKQQI